MNINREAEVSIHAIAADMEFTIERLTEDQWQMTIEGVDWNREVLEHHERKVTHTYMLTDAQASATLALFVGELKDNRTLNAALYEIAEEVWKNTPQAVRPIP